MRLMQSLSELTADIMQSSSLHSCNRTSPEVCKKATLSTRESSNCKSIESRDLEPAMLKKGAEVIGCTYDSNIFQSQLANGGAALGLPGTESAGRELRKEGIHALKDLKNTPGEPHNACRAQVAAGSAVGLVQLASRSFDDSEVHSSSTRFERCGKISQHFSWRRKPNFVPLLKAAREKINGASTEIFNRYYAIRRSSQSPSTKSSWKASSTFVKIRSRVGGDTSSYRPFLSHPSKRRGSQSLIERVGNRSCNGIVRQWVSMKGRESRTSPPSGGRDFWQHLG